MRASQMIGVDVTKPALDIRKSRIGRDSIGDQSADTRPGTICAHHQGDPGGGAIRKVQTMRAVIMGDDICHFTAPLHGVRRKRLQQQRAKRAARDFWSAAQTIIELLEQYVALFIEYARGLTTRKNKGPEGIVQACRYQRPLAIMIVDIQQATLWAGLGRGFSFVDHRGNAVNM
ncbi:hypothetical protein TUSAK1_10500 [Klebsiella variicola]|nr:hypothetical protein NUKP40_31600 [Klebsiella variicola]